MAEIFKTQVAPFCAIVFKMFWKTTDTLYSAPFERGFHCPMLITIGRPVNATFTEILLDGGNCFCY